MEPTHTLEAVVVRGLTIVRKGANRKRWFLRKSDDESRTDFDGLAPLLKGADDWSVAYVVVAEPGWVEEGGQGAPGIRDVWKSPEEIEKAAHDFITNGGYVNRAQHGTAPDGKLDVVESFVAPADLELGGEPIVKGSWVVGVRLDREAREAVEAGDITGVSIEGSGLRVPVGKAADVPSNSLMVALYPSPEAAAKIAAPGGEPADELHLTLGYWPDVNDEDLARISAATRRAIENTPAKRLHGELSGTGVFHGVGGRNGNDDRVTVALVDLPGLVDLHRNLMQDYERSGVMPDRTHGFQPHMTLARGDVQASHLSVPHPIRFGHARIVRRNGELLRIPLREEVGKVSSRTYPSLERVPGKQNWVDRAGGLPDYIERIAKHLHYEQGKSISTAIAMAVSTVKRWAAGGGGVSPETQAKAARAVAEWEAKKGRSKVTKVLDALRKAMRPETKIEDLTEEERELIAKISGEIEGSGGDPGTVEKESKANANEETDDVSNEKIEELAKSVGTIAEAVKAQGDALEKLLKAAEPEEKPTAESLREDVNKIAEAVLEIGKKVDALGEGGSAQPDDRRSPVTKSEAPAGALTGLFG